MEIIKLPWIIFCDQENKVGTALGFNKRLPSCRLFSKAESSK